MNRYAVSDLHGQLDLYNQIKEYINDDDILYVLGDCNDRGPHPWATLKSVLDDGQCCLLMGNHEYMLWRAADYVLNTLGGGIKRLLTDDTLVYSLGGRNNPVRLLYYNGGYDTLKQWALEPEHLRYLVKIKGLPIELRLAALDGEHMIYLTHTGLTPGVLEGEVIDDFVWDRNHIYDEWESNGNLSIGGHSPINYLVEQFDFYNKKYELKEGCLFYNNGSKICIDRAAHYTGETVLLNIDTLEGKIFKTDVVDL